MTRRMSGATTGGTLRCNCAAVNGSRPVTQSIVLPRQRRAGQGIDGARAAEAAVALQTVRAAVAVQAHAMAVRAGARRASGSITGVASRCLPSQSGLLQTSTVQNPLPNGDIVFVILLLHGHGVSASFTTASFFAY